MHGFYLDKEEKLIRFDIVISLSVPNRRELCKEVMDDVQAAFPDYTLQVTMDTDFSEK